MKSKKVPLIEGRYRSSEGELFTVTSLHTVDGETYTFELVESEDPDDPNAIATDLTSEEWPRVAAQLGLEPIDAQTALEDNFKRSVEQVLAGDTHDIKSLWDDEPDG